MYIQRGGSTILFTKAWEDSKGRLSGKKMVEKKGVRGTKGQTSSDKGLEQVTYLSDEGVARYKYLKKRSMPCLKLLA